jgi:hypothetical protein
MGRPLGARTLARNTAAEPLAFAGKAHRPAQRIPILHKIEENLQRQIGLIRASDPELRGLVAHSKVEAYQHALRIVRSP